jgi:ATP-binding cassette subfamily F protein 3
LLTLDKVSKFYGGRAIFDGASWSMTDDARVALVGLNGAGKTTLLRMVAGVVEPDAGRVSRPQRTRVGYLPQDAPEMGGRSVLEETLSALEEVRACDRRRVELEGILARETSGPAHDAALAEFGEVLSELERHDFYSAESRATSVLFGLGFTDEDLARDVAELSGGIRMRIALAKLLLQRPEFLMLDEPTNHLDIEARNWLEDYLADYPGGIILVSHDRYFLDRVTTRTVEVARGSLSEYAGNYSYYLTERERRFEFELAAYEKQRVEIEHVQAFISRFRYQASKAKLVQSRIKQLEKIERREPPAGLEKPPAIAFPSCERSARRVVELSGAVKRYGELTVYDGVSLEIERGARIDDDTAAGGRRSAYCGRADRRRARRDWLLRAEPRRVARLYGDGARRTGQGRARDDHDRDSKPARRGAFFGRRRPQARGRALGWRADAAGARESARAAQQLSVARRADQQPRYHCQGRAARSAQALPRHRRDGQPRPFHPE